MALHIIKTTDVTQTINATFDVLDVYSSDLDLIVEYLGRKPTRVSVDSTETEEFWETAEIEGFECEYKVENSDVLFFGTITVNGKTCKAVAIQNACPIAVVF